MEALQILRKARLKIATPSLWGKGQRGRDRSKHTCCAAEAIEEAHNYDLYSLPERARALRAVANAGGADHLPAWNDQPERTHAEVLAAFDLAIATLKL